MPKTAAPAASARDTDTVEMFPELVPTPAPVKPAPMSDAVRQRNRRKRLAELRESEGLKSVNLTGAERQLIARAMALVATRQGADGLQAREVMTKMQVKAPATLQAFTAMDRTMFGLDQLEREIELLTSERTKALDAVEVYVQRLGRAGLSTDYRRQPGE